MNQKFPVLLGASTGCRSAPALSHTSNNVLLCSSPATPPDQPPPASPGPWCTPCAGRGTGTGGNREGSSGKPEHGSGSVGTLLSQRQPLLRACSTSHTESILQGSAFCSFAWPRGNEPLPPGDSSLPGEEPPWSSGIARGGTGRLPPNTVM